MPAALKYTATDFARMRRLRAEGLSLRQIAKLYDCSHVYVLYQTQPPPQAQGDARSVTPEAR